MRAQAWRKGDHVAWAKLTWTDIARFFETLARGGVKGLATLFAALIGLGTILVETNIVSGLIVLGSALGMLASHALKSGKGGVMSAALLLFGVMTIWLPSVRAAVFGYPFSTFGVIVCLGLIVKFAQEGGVANLMTGGLLGAYVITIVVSGARPPQPQAHTVASVGPTTPQPDKNPQLHDAPRPSSHQRSSPQNTSDAVAASVPPPPARTLLAAPGSMLKFVAGVNYRLRVRTEMTTVLTAITGSVSMTAEGQPAQDCLALVVIPAIYAVGPYRDVTAPILACGGDAVMMVGQLK